MYNKIIGRTIKAIRLEKGLTMEKFGEILNTSKSSVSMWEKGRSLPNKERLKTIADMGNITVEELTGLYTKDTIIKLINERISLLTDNSSNMYDDEFTRFYEVNKRKIHDNIENFTNNLVQSYYTNKNELIRLIDEFLNTLENSNPPNDWELLDNLSNRVSDTIDWLDNLYNKDITVYNRQPHVLPNNKLSEDIYNKLMPVLTTLDNIINKLIDEDE